MKEVIHHKSKRSVMREAGDTCLMGQVRAKKQKRVFSKVLSNIITTKTGSETTVEDLETGYEVFHAVVFCQPMVLQICTMINQLLSVETTRTIIQTIANLFHSGTLTDEITFTLTKQFYQVLADTLDLQYGNILLASSTTAQMQAMFGNKWPFFFNYTDLVKECLEESNCDPLQKLYQDLGKISSFFFFKLLN